MIEIHAAWVTRLELKTPPAMPQPNAVDLVRPAILLVGLLVVLALLVGH
jgi:hypothetical protein